MTNQAETAIYEAPHAEVVQVENGARCISTSVPVSNDTLDDPNGNDLSGAE